MRIMDGILFKKNVGIFDKYNFYYHLWKQLAKDFYVKNSNFKYKEAGDTCILGIYTKYKYEDSIAFDEFKKVCISIFEELGR